MNISTKGRYGLYFMNVLAIEYGVRKRSVKSIANERGVSDLYLEQIVACLRRANLVKSTRGAYGGYELNYPPDEITVLDVFKAVGENIVAIELDDKDTKNERFLWKRIRDGISDVISHTTLYDLISQQDEFDDYMFYI